MELIAIFASLAVLALIAYLLIVFMVKVLRIALKVIIFVGLFAVCIIFPPIGIMVIAVYVAKQVF
jgi:hypothetical protein